MNRFHLTMPAGCAPAGEPVDPCDVGAAVRLAQITRRRLGIVGRAPIPDDVWLLADSLAGEIRIEARDVHTGGIHHLHDGRGLIALPRYERDPWRLADHLAHQIGHQLLTAPTAAQWRDGLPDWYEREPSAQREALATAFGRAFMGRAL